MLTHYFAILVFVALGAGFGLAPLVMSYIVGIKHPNDEKLSPYECGFAPFEDARMPFDVRFYLVAILFIIFDLETAFLFPWGVVLRELSWVGIGAMGAFLGLLIVGFAYEWKKGGLEWE